MLGVARDRDEGPWTAVKRVATGENGTGSVAEVETFPHRVRMGDRTSRFAGHDFIQKAQRPRFLPSNDPFESREALP